MFKYILIFTLLLSGGIINAANLSLPAASIDIALARANQAITTNYTGSVSINGVVTANDFVDNNFVLGEFAVSYNSTAQPLTTGGTYTTWNAGTLYKVNEIGCTISTTNGTITVSKAGLYITGYSLSIAGTNGHDIHGGCALAGSNPGAFCECSVSTTGTGNYAGLGGKQNFHRLTAGQTVCMKLENETSATAVTIEHGNFWIMRVAP